MSALINIISYTTAYFFGLFITCFTVIQVLIIALFGIPYTIKLDRLKILKKGGKQEIVKGYIYSAVLLLSVFTVVTYFVYRFGKPNVAISYGAGAIFSLLLCIGKVGFNKNNESDYLSTNRNFLQETQNESGKTYLNLEGAANTSKNKWKLEGWDVFDAGNYDLKGEYDTEEQAIEAAKSKLLELEKNQPTETSGGQSDRGVQDRVFIVRPDGSKYRYLP